jgi:hypothetical protein
MSKSIVMTVLIGVLGLGAAGCATHAGNGALIGGTSGALIGAGIGSVSHQRAGEGALLGGAIGALGGALVGNEVDKQQQGYYGNDGGYDRPAPAPYYADNYGYAPAPVYTPVYVAPPTYVYTRYNYYGHPHRYYGYHTVHRYGCR